MLSLEGIFLVGCMLYMLRLVVLAIVAGIRRVIGDYRYQLYEDVTTILDEDGNLADWYTSPDYSVGS